MMPTFVTTAVLLSSKFSYNNNWGVPRSFFLSPPRSLSNELATFFMTSQLEPIPGSDQVLFFVRLSTASERPSVGHRQRHLLHLPLVRKLQRRRWTQRRAGTSLRRLLAYYYFSSIAKIVEPRFGVVYFHFFFYPLSPCLTFLASYFCTDWLSRLGLGNQVVSTTDHLDNCHLPSTKIRWLLFIENFRPLESDTKPFFFF